MSAKDTPKIGTGHVEAMFRQGLAELRAAFYADSNVAQPAQYGLYGTRTPGEVAEARRFAERDYDEELLSTVAERLQSAENVGREQDTPQSNRDRE